MRIQTIKTMSNNNNFYCQRMCGDENFCIEEWNKVFHELEKTNMSEKEKDAILMPETLGHCDTQCFDCLASVGSRRIETKKLIKNQQSKH